CGSDADKGILTSIHVWNALTGEQAAVLRGGRLWSHAPPPGVYPGLRFLRLQASMVSHTMAPGGGGLVPATQLEFADETTRLMLLHMWPGELRDLAFSPDSQLVAATDQRGRLQVWERATGNMLFRRDAHPIPNMFANQSWYTTPTFSPDGKLVATASTDDATCELWNARTGDFVRALWQGPLNKDEGFSRAVFSPNGKWVAAGGRFEGVRILDPSVRVWEVGQSRARYTFRGTMPFTCLAFNSD